MERLMDLGARRLGLHPAEIRRRNRVRPDEMPYRPGLTYKDGVPIAYDPGDFPSAFERALGLLRYDDWRRRQTAQAGTARRIGLGLACYAQGTGLGPYEGATVRVDPSGKVYVLIGVASQGQGHATTLAQIAASELGAAFKSKALLTLGEPGLNACTYFHPETVTWAFGTHAAVVEVDVEACLVRLLAYAIVHDPGRAINPTIVEGQLQGGAAQSIGAGLM